MRDRCPEVPLNTRHAWTQDFGRLAPASVAVTICVVVHMSTRARLAALQPFGARPFED